MTAPTQPDPSQPQDPTQNPTQPHQPAPTTPGQPDPQPAPGTVLPGDRPDDDPNREPRTDQEEGEKYDGGDIPQTGTEDNPDENQTNE
jgi:hypothetical protein